MDQHPADDGQDQPQFASILVPPWARNALRSPAGRRSVMMLGWLLELAALVALVWSAYPQVAATFGESGVTYSLNPVVDHPAPGWLGIPGVFGLLLGFNLIYWYAPPARRVRQMAWVVALNVAEFLGVMGCVIWVTGAGYPAGTVFDLNARGADPVPGVSLFLLLAITAAGIMLWLGSSSDFDQKRDEYLYQGTAAVKTRKLAVRTHLLWLAAPLAVWLLLLIPMLLSNLGSDGYGPDAITGDLPWPRKATFYDDNLSSALTMYAVLLAILWSVSASMLIEKVLYRGRWADRAAQSPQQAKGSGWFPRLLVTFRHWPFVVAALALTTVVYEPPDPSVSRWGDVAPAGVFAVICVAAGLLLIRWEWKVRDLTSQTLRLHLAGS